MAKPIILAVVEDPGAANMVKDLPLELAGHGVDLRIIAVNHAAKYLDDRNVKHEIWSQSSPEQLLNLMSPELIVVGSSDNKDSPVLALILAAREKQIPTIGFVDMRMNADRRFKGHSEDSLAFVPDYLVVPDQNTADDYIKLGLSAERVLPLGNPQFESVKEKARKLLSATTSLSLREKLLGNTKPTITFVAEPDSTLNPDLTTANSKYKLKGQSNSKRRCLIVLEEFLAAVSRTQESGQVQLILRLHPRNTASDFDTYKDQLTINSGGDPLELILASDLVVGMTSMLLLEAAIVGTPTISIVPDAMEAQWLPTVAAGITPCATTAEEIDVALINWQSQNHLSPKEPWFQPGALNRIADFLYERLKKK